MTGTLRIGTRGSQLALAQARWVQAWLQRHLAVDAPLVIIKTTGDRVVDQPLSTIGGKGLFVKEIEEALLAGRIDCAVHSMKDVPTDLLPGMVIAAVPPREDPRDILVSPHATELETLPAGTRLGTSSLRRMALVRSVRPDVEVAPLRGNVDSRLRKLDQRAWDALILAAAGLRRLGIVRADVTCLDPEHFIPAIGQGALAIESRDDESAAALGQLDHAPTRVAITAERAFLCRVGGSCHTPLAAHATVDGARVALRALIAAPDGTRVVRGARHGAAVEAAALGTDLADELLGRGGADILRGLEVGDGR